MTKTKFKAAVKAMKRVYLNEPTDKPAFYQARNMEFPAKEYAHITVPPSHRASDFVTLFVVVAGQIGGTLTYSPANNYLTVSVSRDIQDEL